MNGVVLSIRDRQSNSIFKFLVIVIHNMPTTTMTTAASSVDKATTTITMGPEDLNGESQHNRRNARTRRRIGTATTVRRRHRPIMLLLMIVCTFLFSSSLLLCSGWVLSPHPISRMSPSARSSSSASAATVTLAASNNDSTEDVDVDVDKAQDDDGEEDGGISDIDARVLRSLLQDSEKLDLQQEENMKKLLERGVTSKAKVELPNDDDEGNPKATRDGGGGEEEEIPYSSQVLQTLADTKLWRKLKRNAEDWVESAQIAITNRIERDAKLVASLGIFAFERALKDVERALPAASSAVPTARKIFQLTDTSSYEEPPPAAKVEQEQQQDPKELSSADLRKEFATPQDEIRSVSKEIQEIFQKADQEAANKQKASPFFATRATDNKFFASPKPSGPKTPLVGTGSGANTLKSTARRGAARLDQAYQRQKQTTLAREKENVAQTGSRLASNLVESAYQVQREIQSDEVNEPGYKTKRLRQATASTARQLAAAARQTSANLLSAAQQKNRADSALPASSSTADAADEVVVDAAATTSGQVEAKPVDFVDDQTYFAFKRERDDDKVASTTTEYDVNEDVGEESSGVDFGNDVKAKFVDVMDAAVVVDVERDIDVVDDLSSNFVDTVSTSSTRNIAADDYASIYADMANVGASTGIVDPSATTASFFGEDSAAGFVDQEDEDGTIRQVMAEVITDDDFEGAVGAAKEVDNMSAEELLEALDAEENEGKDSGPPNILVQLSLRSLDVVFLVAEKVILLLPGVISVSTRVSTRFVEVSRDGLGQQGWQPLKTKVRGDRRY